MKNTLNIRDKITFLPEMGRIQLEDKRMVLMDAEALGMLRRDLVSSLGLDRAKGFLLRYGWHYGSNLAQHLSEIFALDSSGDWLAAGGQVHGMTGYVKVDIKELRFDPKTNDYYAEGYWFDSIEAEQHVKHFGYHHEPVCFTLVGHAGGYVSTHLGQRIIFKEVECMGKGDPHCRWIGKPIQDWDGDIEGELLYYEEENLAQELDRAFLRIERQKEIFKRALNINQKLSKVLLEGGGLSAVVRVLGKELKHAVVIENKNFQPLESYGLFGKHDFPAFIASSKHEASQQKWMDPLFRGKRTVQMTCPDPYGGLQQRLISPILIKNEVWGYISFIKNQGAYNEMEFISIERAATICAIQLLNERTALETAQQIKGEFLNELVSGHYKEEELAYRMQILGYDLNRDHYVFVFHLEYTDDLHRKDLEEYLVDVKKKITESILHHMASFGQNGLISTKLNQIIALIPRDMIQRSGLKEKEFGQFIVSHISQSYESINIMLGISSVCKQMKAFKKGFEEAQKAIEILKLKKSSMQVLFFGELGSIGKILCSENLSDLEQFAIDLLKGIKDYDEKSQSDLLKTLYCFVENQGNMQQTSREMSVSLGAIRYRLKKIQELTQLDLAMSQDFFDAHLAVQIYVFLGMMK